MVNLLQISKLQQLMQHAKVHSLSATDTPMHFPFSPLMMLVLSAIVVSHFQSAADIKTTAADASRKDPQPACRRPDCSLRLR